MDRCRAQEIAEIKRQSEAWTRAASTQLARGSVRVGLDAYRNRGCIRLIATRADAKRAIAAQWMEDRHRGGHAIILAQSSADVRDLNNAIRLARHATRYANRELMQESLFSCDDGDRGFAVGDRVVFRKTDNQLGVAAGMLGTLKHSGEDGSLTVRLDGKNARSLRVDPASYAAFDHGYAVSIEHSQGVAVDRAYVLACNRMDRTHTYVAMSRHRWSARLYAGQDDFHDYEALTVRLGRESGDESRTDDHDPGFTARLSDDRRRLVEALGGWVWRAGTAAMERIERLRGFAGTTADFPGEC